MTTGGWVTMLLSVGFVTGLLVWCLYRVFRGMKQPHGDLAHIKPVEEEDEDGEG